MKTTYWDEWVKHAEGFLRGEKDDPPPEVKTHQILALIEACREVDRVLSEKTSTASMPHTHKLVKKALRGG